MKEGDIEDEFDIELPDVFIEMTGQKTKRRVIKTREGAMYALEWKNDRPVTGELKPEKLVYTLRETLLFFYKFYLEDKYVTPGDFIRTKNTFESAEYDFIWMNWGEFKKRYELEYNFSELPEGF